MQKFPGKRAGSFVYVYNDYAYNIDSRNGYLYRCNTRRQTKCRGSVCTDGDNITIIAEHDHPGQKYLCTKFLMVQEMSELSRNTLLPLKKIFDDVCRKYPEAAAYCSFNTLRPTLQKIRATKNPKIPETLDSLYQGLQNYEPLQNMKINFVKSEVGEIAVILSTEGLLKSLSKSKELFVDGTFAVLPKKPQTGQLYTIHMRYMDNGIATILVLCEKRTSSLYTAIWQEIFKLIPEMPINIKFIMSDYEQAAVNTLSRLFPNAHIHGCWFHYCQAILRKWRKLGLTNAPNNVVRMAMSLPLVPGTKFQEGLVIIQREADIVSNNFPNVLLFMAYMRTNWLKMASHVSVHNCPVRTNNIAESFHNIAGLKLGKQNINVWIFLEKVRDLLIDQELDLNRLQNGIACRRPRTYANINRRKKIATAQAEYDIGRLSLEELLRSFNYGDRIFQINKIDTLANEDIDDEIADADHFAETTPTSPMENDKIERTHRRRSRRVLCNTTSISSDSSKAENRNGSDCRENELPVLANVINREQNETREAEIQVVDTNSHSHSSSCLTRRLSEMFIESDLHVSQKHILECRTENRQNAQNFNDGSDISNIDRDAVVFEILDHAEGYCTMCFINKATEVFVPCGHLALCLPCVKQCNYKQCPICNDKITMHVTLRKP